MEKKIFRKMKTVFLVIIFICSSLGQPGYRNRNPSYNYGDEYEYNSGSGLNYLDQENAYGKEYDYEEEGEDGEYEDYPDENKMGNNDFGKEYSDYKEEDTDVYGDDEDDVIYDEEEEEEYSESGYDGDSKVWDEKTEFNQAHTEVPVHHLTTGPPYEYPPHIFPDYHQTVPSTTKEVFIFTIPDTTTTTTTTTTTPTTTTTTTKITTVTTSRPTTLGTTTTIPKWIYTQSTLPKTTPVLTMTTLSPTVTTKDDIFESYGEEEFEEIDNRIIPHVTEKTDIAKDWESEMEEERTNELVPPRLSRLVHLPKFFYISQPAVLAGMVAGCVLVLLSVVLLCMALVYKVRYTYAAYGTERPTISPAKAGYKKALDKDLYD